MTRWTLPALLASGCTMWNRVGDLDMLQTSERTVVVPLEELTVVAAAVTRRC